MGVTVVEAMLGAVTAAVGKVGETGVGVATLVAVATPVALKEAVV